MDDVFLVSLVELLGIREPSLMLQPLLVRLPFGLPSLLPVTRTRPVLFSSHSLSFFFPLAPSRPLPRGRFLLSFGISGLFLPSLFQTPLPTRNGLLLVAFCNVHPWVTLRITLLFFWSRAPFPGEGPPTHTLTPFPRLGPRGFAGTPQTFFPPPLCILRSLLFSVYRGC